MFGKLAGAPHQDVGGIFQRFRRRHLGHIELMIEAGLERLEGGGEIEDLHAMLNRHHPSGGKAFAVAGAVDFKKNRNPGIARAQEIGVKGMAEP